MTIFLDTNYREHGARDLLQYLDKDRGLLDRTGKRMSEEEIEAFVEQSEEYGFERQIIISPENGDRLSDRKFSHYTRQVMSEFCTDRPTSTYCYAIHRDTDHPHTQVAVTGTKRDLRMEKADCEQLRDRAHEHFHDQHRELTQEVSRHLEADLTAGRGIEQAREADVDVDRDREQDHDQGQRQSQSRGQEQSGGRQP